MIKDENEAIERVLRMVLENKITACDGNDIDIIPESVCVHGDNEKALEFVSKIRAALEKEGIEICPMADVIAR